MNPRTIIATPFLAGALIIGAIAQDAPPIRPAIPVSNYEEPPVLRASDLLPAAYLKSAYHTIDEPVSTYGFANRYIVRSKFGTMVVYGDRTLRERVREIYALAAITGVKNTDAYADALKAAAKTPLSVARRLVEHPVGTVSGIPSGAKRYLDRFGEAVRRGGKSEQEDKLGKQLLGFSKQKRQIAARLKIDPYSSNEILQQELNRVAWASVAGQLTFQAAMSGVPADVAKLVASGSRTTSDLVNALYDNDPLDLRKAGRDRLKKMGIGDELSKGFLDHPTFSPRHKAVIVHALSQLGNAKGRDVFLTMALESGDETDVVFNEGTAYLIAKLHATDPVAEILSFYGLAACHTRSGKLVLPLNWDYGAWTEQAERLADLFLAHKIGTKKVTGHQILMTGRLTGTARAELKKRAIEVTENALGGS